MNRTHGFTLVEVIVALAVVAIGLLALAATVANYTRQAEGMEARSIATWIAADRLAEFRLQPGFPDAGEQDGTQLVAGRDWAWRAVISPAPGESDLRRIDVAVAPADDPEHPAVVLTGFIGRHRVTTTAEDR